MAGINACFLVTPRDGARNLDQLHTEPGKCRIKWAPVSWQNRVSEALKEWAQPYTTSARELAVPNRIDDEIEW